VALLVASRYAMATVTDESGFEAQAGRIIVGVHYKKKRGRAAFTLHTHDGVALHYTCPTLETVHWASPRGRPQHWYVKWARATSQKERRKKNCWDRQFVSVSGSQPTRKLQRHKYYKVSFAASSCYNSSWIR